MYMSSFFPDAIRDLQVASYSSARTVDSALPIIEVTLKRPKKMSSELRKANSVKNLDASEH
jgi:hypothetical protein